MKIRLIVVGKTTDKHIDALCRDYIERIAHYVPFVVEVQPELRATKGLTPEQQKEKEGQELLSRFKPGEQVVLLDERGRELRSVELADRLQRRMASGIRQLTFVIGGPYGFSQAVYDRADAMLSLSRLTFSHQMIRLLFVEQIYRAQTILKGEPYHHE